MNKLVVFYERVSLEIQTKNDAVSIDQQQADMQALCTRNGWNVVGIYKDAENYRATLPPDKGKVVNPSGERADRPQFLQMLEAIKSGNVDSVLCWRDDRLVRHPRVAVALEDALDIGDKNRNGAGPIQIYDATGSVIDRFTLSIKATIWREENKRRAERSRMGKFGSIKDGHWPGEYRRYGYKSVKIPGKRGRAIELDPETAPIVKKIFELYDSGIGVTKIRQKLVTENTPQIYTSLVKREWSKALISRILRSEEYLGKAIWRFNDGTVITITIPQIIEPDLFQRVQDRMDRNKVLSPRNAKGIYLLQGLLYCGDCGYKMMVAKLHGYTGDYGYRCFMASHYPNEGHPKPNNHSGIRLDDAVWREIVDQGLKRPEIIKEQIGTKVLELQAEGEEVDNQIMKAQKRLEEIDQERAFYQKQAAREKITESEFDRRMDETEEQIKYWEDELERLKTLKYDRGKVRDSLDYAEVLFKKLCDRLDRLDCDRDTLLSLPIEEREAILIDRRDIIRALVDRITVNSERKVVIEGVLDGSEGSQFELRGY